MGIVLLWSPRNDENEVEEQDGRESSMFVRDMNRFRKIAAMVASFTGITALSGCGSNSPKPFVQPIVFTDINGTVQPSVGVLNVNQGTYMMVNVTDDTGFLGADWSVSCASALPPGTPLPPGQVQDLSCGSFSPEHSLSGPIIQGATSAKGYVVFYTAPAAVPKGGTVTLIASAAADHSRFSAVTVTIAP